MSVPTRDRHLSYAEWQAAEEELAVSKGINSYFSQLFPDGRTRFAFVITLLLVIGVAAYWSVNTIQTKWVRGIQHPQQIITFERFSTLPALFGIAFTQPLIDNSYAAYRKTLPSFSSTVLNLTAQYVDCSEMVMWYQATLCQPTDGNGTILFKPHPEENLSGESANAINMDNFPLQYRALSDQMCFYTFLFFNKSIPKQYFSLPYEGALPLSSVETTRVNEYIQAGIIKPYDPVLFEFVNDLLSPIQLVYNQQRIIFFKATKNVDIHGKSTLTYEWNMKTDIPLSQLGLDTLLEELIATQTDPVEAIRLRNMSVDPNLEFFAMTSCLAPLSFEVQVITEVVSYGWLNFLSDSGGFLNILGLVVFFFFPLAHRVTQPRNFLPLFLIERYQKQKLQQKMASAQAVDDQSRTQPPFSTNDANKLHTKPALSHSINGGTNGVESESIDDMESIDAAMQRSYPLRDMTPSMYHTAPVASVASSHILPAHLLQSDVDEQQQQL